MSFNFDMYDSFGGFTPATPPDGCTQCGICLSTCPTFAVSKDPEQSPMGRIRLMRALENDSREGKAPALEKSEKLESCLGCYSCEAICPSKVDFGNMLDESLARLREQQPLPGITRMMLFLAERRSLLKSLVQATYLMQTIGLRGLFAKLGLYKLIGMQRADAPPAFAVRFRILQTGDHPAPY